MPTDKERETARANGRKSHGPITEEGKATSSQNSVKHGAYSTKLENMLRPRVPLTEREAVLSLSENGATLPGDPDSYYERAFNAALERYQPQDILEMEQVEFMAIANWNLRRVLAALRVALHQSMHRNVPDEDLHFNDNSLYFHTLHAAIRESTNPEVIALNRQASQWRRQYRSASRNLQELIASRPKPQAPTQSGQEEEEQKIRNEPVEELTQTESTDEQDAPRRTASEIRDAFGYPPAFGPPPPSISLRKEAPNVQERVFTAAA
jgi:hypothetical protein